MDERQLRILGELGRLGSVRAVAEALHVTPSAVSQQLRLLQRRVAVPLTEKRGRTLSLTGAGRALAAAGAEVEIALANVSEVARALSDAPQGTVSVSAFNSAALALFPPLLRALGEGPVRVELSDEDVAQDVFPRLTSRIDVVLAHRLDHTPDWPDTVQVVPLLHEPLDVAIPAGHPLASRRSVRPAEVAGLPWITTHDGFPVLATVEAISMAAGRPVERAHLVNEFSVAVELVRAGAGVALIPRWTVPRPEGVELVPLEGLAARRHIDALVRADRMARPAVRRVLDLLAEIAPSLEQAR